MIKSRERIVGGVKGAESPYVQGTKYYKEDLVVREIFPVSTGRPLVIETGTDRNHGPVVKSQNEGASANSQETPLSMCNLCLEGTVDQSVTSLSR